MKATTLILALAKASSSNLSQSSSKNGVPMLHPDEKLWAIVKNSKS
jgi:hypothetical protein